MESQNINAVYIDQFGKSGHTSIKTINPPGGKSNFSLGWSEEPAKDSAPKYGRKRFEDKSQNQNPNFNNKPSQQGVHTNVKISQNPGGKSSIVFGDDNTNYDNYRK